MADYARKYSRGRIATVDLDSSSDDEPIHDNDRLWTDDDRSNSDEFDNSGELDHDELHQPSPDDETVPGEPQEDDLDIEQALEDELGDYDLPADEATPVFGFGVGKEEGDSEEAPVDEEA